METRTGTKSMNRTTDTISLKHALTEAFHQTGDPPNATPNGRIQNEPMQTRRSGSYRIGTSEATVGFEQWLQVNTKRGESGQEPEGMRVRKRELEVGKVSRERAAELFRTWTHTRWRISGGRGVVGTRGGGGGGGGRTNAAVAGGSL